jgi:hypothetical protein
MLGCRKCFDLIGGNGGSTSHSSDGPFHIGLDAIAMARIRGQIPRMRVTFDVQCQQRKAQSTQACIDRNQQGLSRTILVVHPQTSHDESQIMKLP